MAPRDPLRPKHLPLDNDVSTLNYDVDTNQAKKNGPGPEALAFILSHPEIITFVAKHPEAIEFFMKHPNVIKHVLDHPDALKFMMEHPEAISWVLPPKAKEKRSIGDEPNQHVIATIEVESVRAVGVQDVEMPLVPLMDPFTESRMDPATVGGKHHENSCYPMVFYFLFVVAVLTCIVGPLIKERNRRKSQRGVLLEVEKGEGEIMA